MTLKASKKAIGAKTLDGLRFLGFFFHLDNYARHCKFQFSVFSGAESRSRTSSVDGILRSVGVFLGCSWWFFLGLTLDYRFLTMVSDSFWLWYECCLFCFPYCHRVPGYLFSTEYRCARPLMLYSGEPGFLLWYDRYVMDFVLMVMIYDGFWFSLVMSSKLTMPPFEHETWL